MGGLRADPRQLIERYFDAFLYLSNWGTHRVMLRLPTALLSAETAARYCVGDAASAWQAGEHTIVDLVAEDENGTFEEDWSYGGGEGRLACVIPARADLLAGDTRLLYLAWLLCVQAGEVPDDVVEPAVPPNLDSLNGSLQSAATFLRIDEDLLAVAAAVSSRRPVDAPTAELERWLTTIPGPEKDALLLRVAQGNEQRVQAELRASFRQTVTPSDADDHGPRTAGEIRALADTRRADRDLAVRQRRKQQAADRERAAASVRAKHLAALADRREQAWLQVDDLIEARKPVDYEVAVALLQDLGEICRREGRAKTYEQRVEQLRQTHRRKVTFIERLDRATSS